MADVKMENVELENVESEKGKGVFTKIGGAIDSGLGKVGGFFKRNGKKLAKGAGIAAGAAVAVVGTAVVLDIAERAKQLEEPAAEEPIDVEPVMADAAPFDEA